jgi:hypothetical protein
MQAFAKGFGTIGIGACAIAALLGMASPAFSAGKNGTTLAASKTIDICSLPPDDSGFVQWRYSGEVSVWNEGVIATSGLNIKDCIQNKTGITFVDQYCINPLNIPGTEIAAGTTQATATVFPYELVGSPLAGYIRNVATVTILNHSGPQYGTAFGPQPKATFVGAVQPCPQPAGCSYGRGYWGSKPDVNWPAPYDRNAAFFTSGLTWQQIVTASGSGNGYLILGPQYVAVLLNQANGAPVPAGVQDVLNQATTWLSSGVTLATCSAPGSCGLQKT